MASILLMLYPFKMILAIFRPEKCEEVKEALKEVGITGMTFTHVTGRGQQAGVRFTSRVGDFVVMPNHVHLVAIAEQGVGKPTPLEDFVRYLKFAITREVHKEYPGVVLWQKGYYEHVIRDDADYERILEYIANNPAQWASDKYFS